MKIGYYSLLRENARLKRRLEETDRTFIGSNTAVRIADKLKEKTKIFNAASYFSYLKNGLLGGTLIYTIEHISSSFRPFFYLIRAFRIIAFVLAYIEAGAVIIIIAAVLLCLLPVAALVFLANELYLFTYARRSKKRLISDISQKKIAVFILPSMNSGVMEDSISYLKSMGYTVFCIISNKDLRLCGMSFFSNCKKADDSVFYIREQYFFIMKKLLEEQSEKFVVIF